MGVGDWIKANRDGLLAGLATSGLVAAVVWFAPGVDEVWVSVLPMLEGNRVLQNTLGAAVAGMIGVAVFAFGVRRGERSRSGLASASPPPPPAPLPPESDGSMPAARDADVDNVVNGWPEFDRNALIADCRILVIDDAKPDKLAMFERRGFDVTLKSRVEHDPANRYEANYDLLLLDQRGVRSEFGASRGSEALGLIRQDNPWLPIILFTSYPQDVKGKRRQEVLSVADEIMRKSLPYDEMEPRLLALLEDRRSRRHFESLLSGLGVEDPSVLLDQVAAGAFDGGTLKFGSAGVSATVREDAKRVLAVAERVVAARRQSQRSGESEGRE